MHEAQLHDENCMVTLTYNDDNLPPFPHSLLVDHQQKFMKRLRNEYKNKKIRFFNAGEYGKPTLENNLIARPHWHTILFNHEFDDHKLFAQTDCGDIYTSEKLEKIWGKGHCTITELSTDVAQYVAKYCVKKINGDQAHEHYKKVCPITGDIQNVRPEFATMSRRPGIARDWYKKYKQDIFPSDMVIIKGGTRVKTPRYYDALLQSESPEQLEKIKNDRQNYGIEHKKDSTPKRLLTREKVATAKNSKKETALR